jgi:hypothetical protein
MPQRWDKILVRKGGLEPPCLSAPPPQDGVSANFTTSARWWREALNSIAKREIGPRHAGQRGTEERRSDGKAGFLSPEYRSIPVEPAKCRSGFSLTWLAAKQLGSSAARYNPAMQPNTLTSKFIEFSRWKLLDEYWPRLRGCVESLNDEQVWWRPNEASNSIGNLVLHLNGNVTQWLLAPFAHREDERDRPAEFSQRQSIPKAQLLDTLAATLQQVAAVLPGISESDLLATYDIQGYTVSGLHAVYQVIEHFGLHYGQITYITKMLRDQDLGFYRELQATGRLNG